jgi:hypothetical protein
MVACGPDRTRVRSSTTMSSSGPFISRFLQDQVKRLTAV